MWFSYPPPVLRTLGASIARASPSCHRRDEPLARRRHPHHFQCRSPAMVPRYARPQMTAIWEPEARYRIWFEIEAHATDKLAELGVVPASAAEPRGMRLVRLRQSTRRS